MTNMLELIRRTLGPAVVLTAACTVPGGPGEDPTGAGTSMGPAPGTSSDEGSEPTGEATDADSSGDEGPGSEDSTGPGTTDADGEMLYTSRCSPCHGPQAQGSQFGFELRHPPRGFAEWIVRNGRVSDEFAPTVMAAIPPEDLSDAELEAIFDHLHSFPHPTTGAELYLDYCGNCHGADAAGGEVGVDIRGELGEFMAKIREGAGGEAYDDRLGYMPAHGPDELSDADVSAIAEHVGSL